MTKADDEYARKLKAYVRAGLDMGDHGRAIKRDRQIGCCCIMAALFVFWVSVAYVILMIR